MSNTNTGLDIKAAEVRLQELAPLIAAELGYELVPLRSDQDYSHYREFKGPAGEHIGISITHQHGSYTGLHVFGQFQHNFKDRRVWETPFWSPPTSINVGINKSAKQIAADIKRRVLPTYLPVLAINQAFLAEYEADCAGAQKIAWELADLIGASVEERDAYHPHIDVYRSMKLPEQSFSISVTAEHVDFNALSVSPAIARQILELLVANAEKTS